MLQEGQGSPSPVDLLDWRGAIAEIGICAAAHHPWMRRAARIRSVGGSMHLEYLAVASVGALIATRVFVALVDGHYRAALDLRRATNSARQQAEVKLREQMAKAVAEVERGA